MGVTRALRHSGLARKGLLALVVLAYAIYVAGILLEALRGGLDQLVAAFPYVELVLATVGLLVAGWFISWFFVTEPEKGDEADGADEDAD